MPSSRLAAVVAAALLFSPAAAQEAPRGEMFFDDFDSFDTDRWMASHGWANGDWQNCTWATDAVGLEDGNLTLSFFRQRTTERNYVCGEVQTYAHFDHGVFEARVKTDQGSGINAAFFTYIGPHHGFPHDEIDFEVLTRYTNRVSLTNYVSGQPANGAVVGLPRHSHQVFHTFSFIWEPNRLRWFINGELVHETTEDIPVNPQKIYLSHWGSDTLTDWMGPFTPPGRPLVMEVDWVAYTPLGMGCQFPSSVLCSVN